MLALLLLSTCPLASAPVLLRPDMPPIASPEAPRLYASMLDADLLDTPPKIAPSVAYRWVLDPGRPLKLSVTVPANADVDRALLTVWDWENRPTHEQALPVPCEERMTFAVSGRGTYLLTLDQFRGERCESRLARSFAVCPANTEARKRWRTDEFYLGTCAFPGRQHWRNDFGPGRPEGLTEEESRTLDADLSARLGLQVVRTAVSAHWPAEDQPIDFSRMDRSVAAWTSRGFKLGFQLCKPPDWAILPQYAAVEDPKWRYPKHEGPTRTWISSLVKRYARHCLFIELHNEPDNRDFWRGTPDEFVDYLGWAIDEVRAAAPGVPISSPSYTLIEPEWTGRFARELLGRVDWVSYHSHGDVRGLAQMLKAMRAVHAAAGYAPPTFVNTEMGHAAWRLDMERLMAATAVQKLLTCWAHGHRGAQLYCSRDIGGPRVSARDWGAVDHFMCPRFMYGAVAAFVDGLAGMAFERVLVEDRLRHAYLFRDGRTRVVAAFTPDNQARGLTVETDALRGAMADAMGNRSPVADTSVIRFPASAYPKLLILSNASRVHIPVARE